MEDRSKQLDSLFQSLHKAEKKMSKEEQKQVMIEGAINTRLMCDYVVSCSYLDVVLIICMLHDYVKLMDEVKAENIQYKVYYRKIFMDMADRLATQIEYDYEKQLEKCQKKSQKKDNNSDIGEDAFVLAYGAGAKKKTDKTESSSSEAKKKTKNEEGKNMIKNLAQLKRILVKGTEFEIVAHVRQEYVGQRRRVNAVDNAGFYSIIPNKPGSKETLANNGKGSYLQWNKASFWKFEDGICTLYNNNIDFKSEHIIISFKVL